MTKYFQSNHKSNGYGCSPIIELNHVSSEDCVYLFLNDEDRHGDWKSKLPKLGWNKIGKIGWKNEASRNYGYNVWKYQIKATN